MRQLMSIAISVAAFGLAMGIVTRVKPLRQLVFPQEYFPGAHK